MSKKVITIISCDVCKSEAGIEEGVKLQVIFTTEQTEGRSTKPYLSDQKLDLCFSCMKHLLKGNYLFGAGAQGYNKYHFINKES